MSMNDPVSYPHNAHQQQGSTLIEILVAVLVVSVSLLGHAGLQAVVVDNTHTAHLHGTAAFQASALIARMRTNPGYWKTLDNSKIFKLGMRENSSTLLIDNQGDGIYSSLTNSSQNCHIVTCSPQQQAAFDLSAWGAMQIKKLPNGQALIELIPGPNPVFNIALSWKEKQLSAQGQANSTAADLDKSYQIRIAP